jgi:hypothetical protein
MIYHKLYTTRAKISDVAYASLTGLTRACVSCTKARHSKLLQHCEKLDYQKDTRVY